MCITTSWVANAERGNENEHLASRLNLYNKFLCSTCTVKIWQLHEHNQCYAQKTFKEGISRREIPSPCTINKAKIFFNGKERTVLTTEKKKDNNIRENPHPL